MDVEDCIRLYQTLASKVFKPKRAKFNLLGRSKDLWQVSGAFDADILAQEIKNIIQQAGLLADAKLLERTDPAEGTTGLQGPRCRV